MPQRARNYRDPVRLLLPDVDGMPFPDDFEASEQHHVFWLDERAEINTRGANQQAMAAVEVVSAEQITIREDAQIAMRWRSEFRDKRELLADMRIEVPHKNLKYRVKAAVNTDEADVELVCSCIRDDRN